MAVFPRSSAARCRVTERQDILFRALLVVHGTKTMDEVYRIGALEFFSRC